MNHDDLIARLLDLRERFIFQGGSEYARWLADSIAALVAERDAAVAALAAPAQPVKLELGDRFMEILRAIHGDMPDDFADSARMAFVHAIQEKPCGS